MKGKIVNLKRFAVHDGPGIRTTVFFKGCPLNCLWCHNPEGIRQQEQVAYYGHKCVNCGACTAVCGANTFRDRHIFDRQICTDCGKCADICPVSAFVYYGRRMDSDQLLQKLLEDRIFYESSGGGITLSGGECLLQADFCAELLEKCKAVGLHTAVDTCGFVSRENMEKVIPFTDIFLYDVKAITEAVHETCTGRPNGIILENLRYLDSLGCKVEIRIPFVPGYNDGEIEKIGAFLAELRQPMTVRLLPVHDFSSTKYEALGMPRAFCIQQPTRDMLLHAKQQLVQYGHTVILE